MSRIHYYLHNKTPVRVDVTPEGNLNIWIMEIKSRSFVLVPSRRSVDLSELEDIKRTLNSEKFDLFIKEISN